MNLFLFVNTAPPPGYMCGSHVWCLLLFAFRFVLFVCCHRSNCRVYVVFACCCLLLLFVCFFSRLYASVVNSIACPSTACGLYACGLYACGLDACGLYACGGYACGLYACASKAFSNVRHKLPKRSVRHVVAKQTAWCF